MNNIIERLKEKQLLWSAKKEPLLATDLQSTGYVELDRQLGGGFVKSGVIELISPRGIGELRLLMPLWQQAQNEQLLVYINSPGILNAGLLEQAGIDLERILSIHVDEHHQAMWAAEQCLKSGCCSDVLLWHEQAIQIHQLKRLQMAAEEGGCRQLILRTSKQDNIALPVDLSLSLFAHRQGLQVVINKRKRGWPSAPFIVNMAHYWPHLCKPVEQNNIVYFPDLKKIVS
ncbi:translesion DNA synthesis-associated protein ImuA [Thalassotalea maritima]|uniref:translesion DNA synthesis-associated protein ImuA n=1 Tax=Thalassotalea maritima TaxID=3242416 RepID=UPI003528AA81